MTERTIGLNIVQTGIAYLQVSLLLLHQYRSFLLRRSFSRRVSDWDRLLRAMSQIVDSPSDFLSAVPMMQIYIQDNDSIDIVLLIS